MLVKKQCYFLIKKIYSNVPSRDKLLEAEILNNINSVSVILDAGCGFDAAVLSKYSHLVKLPIGIDLTKDFSIPNNKVKAITGNVENLPFKDNSIDLCFSRSVCEHLKNPYKVFRELKRVLKPRGKIIMVTPNKYHYSSIISKMLPISFKRIFLKKVFGEDAYDNFPTFYKANSKYFIKNIAKETGLKIEKIIFIRHYPYPFMFSILLFRLAILYDQFITKLRLDDLQDTLLFILVKNE